MNTHPAARAPHASSSAAADARPGRAWRACVGGLLMAVSLAAAAQTAAAPAAANPALQAPLNPEAAAAERAAARAAVQARGEAAVVAPLPRGDDSNAVRAKNQPGNNAPFWRGVRDSGLNAGTVNLPGAEMGVMIQPFARYPGSDTTTAGEAWRQSRNDMLIPLGAGLILAALVLLGTFYFFKGRLGHSDNDGPPRIQRFTPFERTLHWTNAIAFSILAVSGIVMAFGKFFMRPLIGGTLFGWLAFALKTLHNFIGPLFMITLALMFALFVKDNIARWADFVWLTKAGGMLGDGQVPSHRFNAGEKGMFWWGMMVPGFVAVASGLVLNHLVPGIELTRGNMQVAHIIHLVATCIMMAMLAGHIYMGTIGTRGAFKAMRTGWVDEAWAREHHVLWYDDVKAGKIPAQRRPETDAAATPVAHRGAPAV